MADDIGDIKSIDTTSVALNTQPGHGGGEKPHLKGGNGDPGKTRPHKPEDHPVPMPK